MVTMCALAFTACSKDDGNTDSSGKGEPIIMTALVDEGNEHFGFTFYFNEKDTLIINWGDGCIEKYELEQENNNGGLLKFKCEPEHRYISAGNKIISYSFKEKNIKESMTQLYNETKADLVSLDVSDCVALVELGFGAAQIDASGCEALATLDASDSELTSLNLNGCKWLTYLDCHNNELNSLDLSTNTALQELICWHSWQLSSLDISKNIALTSYLNCRDNNLSASALNKIFNDLPKGKKWDGYEQSTIDIGNNPGTDTCDKSIAENKGWIVRIY